jgi:hypothetical protein
VIGRAIGIAAALWVSAACAADPLTSGPFPCADDGSCPESLTCTAGTSSDPAAAMCMEGCSSSNDCAEGSRCAQVGDAQACLDECTPFGRDCEGATTCRMQPLAGGAGFFATCVSVTGGHEPFGACESAMDCGAQATCIRVTEAEPFTCRPQCDADHPCRKSMTCEPLLPSGAGVCI